LFVDEAVRVLVGGIAAVIRNAIPKCRARQVTVSPSAREPEVTPATACSLEPLIEAA
jgi:hypothetical protein